MKFTHSLVLIGILCFGVPDASADDTVPLAPGTIVRVTVGTRADTLTGRLLRLDGKTLTLQMAGQGDPATLRRSDITAVAVSSDGSRLKGALIGAGVGAVIGISFGLSRLPGEQKSDDTPSTPGEWAELYAMLLTPIGALIGLALPPSENWEEVKLDRIRLGIYPVRGRGLGIALALEF